MESPVILITIAAICSVAAGVWLTSVHAVARPLVPFSGGLLMGVALFWLVPEIAAELTWPSALAWTLGGAAGLALIDRFVYPVCPACSHSHPHDTCETRLHGFAVPLLIAASIHSVLDGWIAASARDAVVIAPALVVAIGFHKVPEGLALGVIARASLASRATAFAWCAAAQAGVLAGAAMAPHLPAVSLYKLPALAAGSFLYLGGHAVHGELRRSGPAPAFWPALTGVAGSSVLRFFVS